MIPVLQGEVLWEEGQAWSQDGAPRVPGARAGRRGQLRWTLDLGPRPT